MFFSKTYSKSAWLYFAGLVPGGKIDKSSGPLVTDGCAYDRSNVKALISTACNTGLCIKSIANYTFKTDPTTRSQLRRRQIEYEEVIE